MASLGMIEWFIERVRYLFREIREMSFLAYSLYTL